MHSPVNDAQQAWLTGTSQRLTSHRYIPAASWAHFTALCAHSSQCLVFSLACVHLHVHNRKQSTETWLGIAILSGAAERGQDHTSNTQAQVGDESHREICPSVRPSVIYPVYSVTVAGGAGDNPDLRDIKLHRGSEQNTSQTQNISFFPP